MRMVLTADKTLLFRPTVFSQMTETLAVEALRDQTGDRNSSTSYTMPVTWQTRFCEMINFESKDWEDPTVLFAFLSVQPWRMIFC